MPRSLLLFEKVELEVREDGTLWLGQTEVTKEFTESERLNFLAQLEEEEEIDRLFDSIRDVNLLAPNTPLDDRLFEVVRDAYQAEEV